MNMKALNITLFAALLAIVPAFAFAADSCDCLCEQVEANSHACDNVEQALAAYCPEDSNRFYGAIGYEMRFTDDGVAYDFDQRMRFAINYFSQLSDNLSLHVGFSDRFDGLPNSDPFGFEQDIREIQRDMRVDEAYAHYRR